jgi:hypothetical protein
LAITAFAGAFGGILVSASAGEAVELDALSSASQFPIATGPVVTLRAASGEAVRFLTQNGPTPGDGPPQARDLPHLVLTRNGGLTDADERTLIVEVAGFEVPPGGATITLKVETQGGDPDLGDDPNARIMVWHESQWIANSSGAVQTGIAALFRHEFTEAVMVGSETSATPTDYFRYDIVVIGFDQPIPSPLYAVSGDYAFLMESQ